MNYGDPDRQARFETLKTFFPESLTMRDIFQLLRLIFPLLIQFVILALDYTLDAVDTTSEDPS